MASKTSSGDLISRSQFGSSYHFSMSEFVALHRGPPPMPVRTAHRQLNQQQPMNIIETGIESGTMRLRTIGSSQQATALEIETSAQRHL
jgi:hypothetical protein